jgi:integrase
MASIAKDANGRKRILFFNPAGERKTIRLGRESMHNARTIASHVQFLVAAKANGTTVEPATIHWLTTIGVNLYGKLVKHGLASPRENFAVVTLATFLNGYVAGRTDLKPRTIIKFSATRDYLVEFLGADRPLNAITAGDGDDWRVFLIGKGLSENTVRKHAQIAKQFFTYAVRRKSIESNPFADLKSTVRANPEKFYFVTQKEAAAVLTACPDNQWKLLFALSRYGGLRCPSEHLGLRWGDVNWKDGRITVRSPKTEHHEGKAERVIPLFPELRPYLQAVLDELLADFDPKAHRLSEQPVITRYRDTNANLRTQLHRIIRKAKLTPWPKVFQNLRSTRETELAEQFPIQVVCEWIGNSEAVARKHYLQVTDEHFATAIGPAIPEAAQKAAHFTTLPIGMDGNEPEQECENPGDFEHRRDLVVSGIAEEGLEPPTRGL